jgi:hypothetical protein
MALTAYETATQQLLQVPAAPVSLYSTASIDGWINSARNQLAGEGECVRVLATLSTAVGVRNYNFSSIGGLPAAVQSVLHVRAITYSIASGQKWVQTHPWQWFNFYYLNNVTPVNGPPVRWSQFGQGVLGSFYLDPPPDAIYTLNLDCVCLPITLVSDGTAEAIPYPWTDAVPYFAAYLALLSAQSPARTADADRMMQRYELFMGRARQFSNPDVLRTEYLQSVDETVTNKLGLQAAGGGGGGG